MFDQIWSNTAAHGIKHNIDPFAPRKFDRRDKVGISRDHDDLIHLPLERHRSHVKPKAHIDTLLYGVDLEIIISWGEICRVFQPSINRSRLGTPSKLVVKPPKT